MTRSQVDEIISKLELVERRLNSQSVKIDNLTSQIDHMRGGLSVLRALGGLLGVGGIGALLAWLQGQASK